MKSFLQGEVKIFLSDSNRNSSLMLPLTPSQQSQDARRYRKTFLNYKLFIRLLLGFLLGLCNSIELFMVLRVIIGFCSMAVVVVSFVLCVELVSGKWRTIIGILNIFPVAIAYIVCAGISYFTYNWRTMQFVITSPTILLLCLWCKMPESPR